MYSGCWPPLWSSGQSSWLQIQRSGFDSWRYQMFWVVVGLEQGPLSLVSTTEELLDRKGSGSCLESREHGQWDQPHWSHGTNFADERRPLSQYTSLTDWGHGVQFSFRHFDAIVLVSGWLTESYKISLCTLQDSVHTVKWSFKVYSRRNKGSVERWKTC
jgi:hypothetical protein